MYVRTHGRPPAQEYRLRLKRPHPLHLNPRPSSALLRLPPFSVGPLYFASLSAENMTQHIFSFESELQNNQSEVAPSSPNFSLSVSEKLSRYGANALSDVEHLGLLVGKEALAARLLAHFGSLKTLAKVSAVELRSFMTIRQPSASLLLWLYQPGYKLRMLTKNLSIVPKRSTAPASICNPSGKKCYGLSCLIRVSAESPRLISPKALSTNHSLIRGKFLSRQSSILPMPLWSYTTTHRGIHPHPRQIPA
jgi:hypothetical protein